jgi:hypothetical protein
MGELIMIGINYTEFEAKSYESVYVHWHTNLEKLFNSGDVVQDFHDGLEFAKAIKGFDPKHKMPLLNMSNGNLAYSSTIDNFLMDTKGKYKYSEDGEVVKVNKRRIL